MAQVGVNNDDREQTLDAGGKLKIADDGTTPTAGTMRYNSGDNSFEGYNGTAWEDLSPVSNVAPSVAYVQHYYFALAANGIWTIPSESISYDLNSAVDVVPAGKFMVVDKIVVTPRNDVAGSYYCGIRQATGGETFNPFVFIRIADGGESYEMTANRSPLLVITEGRSIQFWNSSSSPGPVRVQIYTMLVDDLSDYYGL